MNSPMALGVFGRQSKAIQIGLCCRQTHIFSDVRSHIFSDGASAMRSLILILMLTSTTVWSIVHNDQQSSSSESSSFTPWAIQNMELVELMAKKLMFNLNEVFWIENIAKSIGKSTAEVNDLAQKLSEKIFSDLQSGQLDYEQVTQQHYFKVLAAPALEKLAEDSKNYDTQHSPVNNVSAPWLKRKIREIVFWLIKDESISSQELEEFENRFRDLIIRSNKTVNEFKEWTLQELDRYYSVVNQYGKGNLDLLDWQKSEQDPIDWLISQNGMTHEDLKRWQKEYSEKLVILAQKYQITISELNAYYDQELKRLNDIFNQQKSLKHNTTLELEFEKWQQEERNRWVAIIKQHDLTIEDYQSMIKNDRERIIKVAHTYQRQVEEIKKWLKEEAQKLKNEGVFSKVQRNLTNWQQEERARLLKIVMENNELTIEELQNKINQDKDRIHSVANTYQVKVDELEDWLKKEIIILQIQGLVKVEKLQDWQKSARENILRLIQSNKLTVEDYEKKLLNEKSYLQQLATKYHIELMDIETWFRKESDRLQRFGLIEKEKLTEWQKIVYESLLNLVQKNEKSIDEIEKKITDNLVNLYSLAHRYSVHVEEIEEWLKKEVRLQKLIKTELANLKDWKNAERDRIMILVRQNNLTIDEFLQKTITDRVYLQRLAQLHNVQIKEIEEWFRNEGTRLESLGLIKPNAALTEWQEQERDRILQVAQDDNQLSLDELEERLKNDRLHLVYVAQDYQVQIKDIEEWIKRELKRLQNQGLVKIEKLKEWQENERKHLAVLVAQQQEGFSMDEFERDVMADRERLQILAYRNNVQVKEIEEWIHKELARTQAKIHNLTEWQRNALDLLLLTDRQHSDLSDAELEKKLENHLYNLTLHYHIEFKEVQEFIRKQIQKLRDEGTLHIENLTLWKIDERKRLQQLIQEQSQLSIEDVEKYLKADRNRLERLTSRYHIQVEEVESWIRKEADRLRNQVWQESEKKRIQQLIQKNSDITFEDLEWQLKADQNYIQQLSIQYHVNVEKIKEWFKKELQRLKDEGKLKVDQLNAWQKSGKQFLLELYQQHSKTTLFEFEEKLKTERRRLELFAQQYHIYVEEIEDWIKQEAERLENQGVIGSLKYWQLIERSRIHEMLKLKHVTFEEFKKQLEKDSSRLENLAYTYNITIEEVKEWILKEAKRLIKPVHHNTEGPLKSWQQHQLDYLLWLVSNNKTEEKNFEELLIDVRWIMEKDAAHFNVTVDEILKFWRNEYQRLAITKPIENSVVEEVPFVIEQWKISANNIIQLLLQKNIKWSIEELERELINNREHIQQISNQYHVSVYQVEQWYRFELQKLLQKNILYSENLTDWQKAEKNRLYTIIVRQQQSFEEIERQMDNDFYFWLNLAASYGIKFDELINWSRKEVKRLAYLGYGKHIGTEFTINQQSTVNMPPIYTFPNMGNIFTPMIEGIDKIQNKIQLKAKDSLDLFKNTMFG